jgi:malate dehydrogenase (oxaloacetate-decarboxylating)(NADP+)
MTVILATTNQSNGIQKYKALSQGSLYMLDTFLMFMLFLASPKVKRGLIPPVLDFSTHKTRCLEQLRSKDKSIEKYIYLSSLKEQDPNMFYKLCLEHMSEFTPIIYTPTVGDACQQYSHNYRHPEGLVCPIFRVC